MIHHVVADAVLVVRGYAVQAVEFLVWDNVLMPVLVDVKTPVCLHHLASQHINLSHLLVVVEVVAVTALEAAKIVVVQDVEKPVQMTARQHAKMVVEKVAIMDVKQLAVEDVKVVPMYPLVNCSRRRMHFVNLIEWGGDIEKVRSNEI